MTACAFISLQISSIAYEYNIEQYSKSTVYIVIIIIIIDKS